MKARHTKIKNFAIKVFDLSEADILLEKMKHGSFKFVESEKFGHAGKYEMIDPGNKVLAVDDKNAKFGLLFDIDVDGVDYHAGKRMVAARWIKTTEDGKKQYPSSFILYGSPIGEWRLLRSMKEIKEASTWTLELYDLNQNLLFQKSFDVTPIRSEKIVTLKSMPVG